MVPENYGMAAKHWDGISLCTLPDLHPYPGVLPILQIPRGGRKMDLKITSVSPPAHF